MPRGVRHMMHSGVSSVTLLQDIHKETLARPARIGQDSQCGCPGYTSTRLIDMEYPPSIAPVYTQLQWDSFLAAVNHNLESTSVPDCPLFPLGVVVPPVFCLFWYCRSSRAREREELLNARIEQENEKLARVGLQWTHANFRPSSCCGVDRVPELRGSLELQMDIPARTEFELNNPQSSQYLAHLLLQRAEKSQQVSLTGREPSAGQQSGKHSIKGANGLDLDESQMKLLNRQVTLQRRNSMNSLSRGAESSNGSAATTAAAAPHPSAAEANTMWNSPAPATFRAIVPEDPAPSQQSMK